MKNPKGFIVPIIALIALIIIGGTYTFYSKKTQNNKEAGWLAYTSEKTGFDFKYPSNWKIEETNGSAIRIFSSETQGKLDTDQPSEAVSISYAQDSCKAADWNLGFGSANYKVACINGGNMIMASMVAFSKETEKIEDIILSSFTAVGTTSVHARTSLEIISPEKTDKLTVGNTYPIIWKSSGLGNQKLFIDLNTVETGKTTRIKTIAEGVPNTGVYSWAVDPSVLSGANYSVRVYTSDNIDGLYPAAGASSGVFSVINNANNNISIPFVNGWKNYTNTKFGISFQYPPNGSILEKQWPLTSDVDPSYDPPYEIVVNLPFVTKYDNWTSKGMAISIHHSKQGSCVSYFGSNTVPTKLVNNIKYRFDDPPANETSGMTSISKRRYYEGTSGDYCYFISESLNGSGPASETFQSHGTQPPDPDAFINSELIILDKIMSTVLIK